MIHKIKGLHDDGQGLSIRAIGQELGISRNTVRKYLRQDVATIEAAQSNREREKTLDAHRVYIIYLLRTFPRLSSVKVARKLREKVGELVVSERTLRRYVQQVKSTVASRQRRYYEPVLDMVPGVQCQVDPGELREVMIGGEPRPLYFVVFVLSYSRLTYIGVSLSPLDTATFIRLHDEAFRYFGGLPEECVYDQTKMVVISEQFRELEVNQRFHEYATTAGFRIHACCGYDPESKGKVEAGVKYAKQDAFYGESFRDEADLRGHVRQWLDEVANVRTHGTTGQQPMALCDAEERHHLRPYLTPACVGREADGLAPRRVDKTGLIAWKANKYSVPMAYQQGRVGVQEMEDRLSIHDLESGEMIATHTLHLGKGHTSRNEAHYRDHRQQEAELEQAITRCLGASLGEPLCARLRATMPRHYKDQLRAAKQLLEGETELDLALIGDWVTRERLTAGGLKERLAAARLAKARGRDRDDDASASPHTPPPDLSQYARLGRSSGHQGVTHGTA
ncbi:IS21 family transposase [Halomonas piscis]|uniref:IS21 family transposase n=1 Tax=Halomonas piscis TaxID=3031727 RepID=A0ABY9YZJ7_9GAMM|nr:IS21 family transposase [Halomonas piscis]WNK20296.1 IS21 family transposase [Halomonas piscis]